MKVEVTSVPREERCPKFKSGKTGARGSDFARRSSFFVQNVRKRVSDKQYKIGAEVFAWLQTGLATTTKEIFNVEIRNKGTILGD